MAAFMMFHWALIVFSLILLIVEGSMAFKFSARTKKPSSTGSQGEDLVDADLSVLVRSLPTDRFGVYSQALQLLSSMQASPSCNRVAATLLLSSCQILEGSTHSTEASLDDIRSTYAAQLAMCEISSAGLAIPQECKSLKPVTEPLGLRGLHGLSNEGKVKSAVPRNIDKSQLSQCLRSLESRPQWWTSYSNSRQNAIVMCQAARADIEKDELIKLHKSMVETSSDIDTALSSALKEVNNALADQRTFAIVVETFRKRLLRDLDSSNAQAQSYFANLVSSVDAATQSIISKITSAAQAAASEVAGLRDNIQSSNAGALDLEKNIRKVFQQAVEGNAELAASQTKQWDRNLNLAIELQNSLENVRSGEVHALLNAFGNIHNQLHTSNELVSLMHSRQNALDERLLTLGQSFAALETKAELFHIAQTGQADSQTLLHDQINRMQTDMYVTHGLLAEVTTSASSLQSAIEDTSAKLARMATFAGITGVALRWGWVLLGLFVLYQFYARYAAYATGTLVFIFLLYSSGITSPFQNIPTDTVLIHYASGTRVPLLPLLKTATVFVLLALIFGFYPATRRFFKLKDRTAGLASTLDCIGMTIRRQRKRVWKV